MDQGIECCFLSVGHHADIVLYHVSDSMRKKTPRISHHNYILNFNGNFYLTQLK